LTAAAILRTIEAALLSRAWGTRRISYEEVGD
jgi:hypothetical protein